MSKDPYGKPPKGEFEDDHYGSSENNHYQGRRLRRHMRARSIAWFLIFVCNLGLGIYFLSSWGGAKSYSVAIEAGQLAVFQPKSGANEILQGGATHTLSGPGQVIAYRLGEAEFKAKIQATRAKGLLSFNKTRTVNAFMSGSLVIDDNFVRELRQSNLEQSIGDALYAAVDENFDECDESDFQETISNRGRDKFVAATGNSFASLEASETSYNKEKHEPFQVVTFDSQIQSDLNVAEETDWVQLFPLLSIWGVLDLFLFAGLAFPEIMVPAVLFSAAFCPLGTSEVHTQVRRRARDAGDCCCEPFAAPDLGCGDCMLCYCDCGGGDGLCAGGDGGCGDCGGCDGCGDCGGCDGCGDCGGCDCSC